MDRTELDKDGKKILDKKQVNKSRAIYFLKDDYLIICESNNVDKRPEKFTISGKLDAVVYVLRRGKLK